jgi:flagellar biogenesis protein FliO
MADPSGLDALARMIPALALIVGALLLVKRWAKRNGGSRPSGEGVRIVSRTGLTRGAVVAVVDVAGRRFLLGAGEQGVRLLTEIDADAVMTPPIPAPDIPRMAATDSPLRTLSFQRPWMGLVSRLQQMTVRSHPSKATDVPQR